MHFCKRLASVLKYLHVLVLRSKCWNLMICFSLLYSEITSSYHRWRYRFSRAIIHRRQIVEHCQPVCCHHILCLWWVSQRRSKVINFIMVIVIVKMMVYFSVICHGLEVVDCGGGDGVSVYLAFSQVWCPWFYHSSEESIDIKIKCVLHHSSRDVRFRHCPYLSLSLGQAVKGPIFGDIFQNFVVHSSNASL